MSTGSISRPARFEVWRLAVIYIAVILAFTGLLFKLINLQVVEGSNWATRATDNFTNEVSVPAPRGIIYDRNGYILARNVASYNVVITPASLPDDDSDIIDTWEATPTPSSPAAPPAGGQPMVQSSGGQPRQKKPKSDDFLHHIFHSSDSANSEDDEPEAVQPPSWPENEAATSSTTRPTGGRPEPSPGGIPQGRY